MHIALINFNILSFLIQIYKYLAIYLISMKIIYYVTIIALALVIGSSVFLFIDNSDVISGKVIGIKPGTLPLSLKNRLMSKVAESSVTASAINRCSDSDRGENILIRGIVSKGALQYPDFCQTASSVNESVCVGERVETRLINCPIGMCFHGKCTDVLCVDTDNGKTNETGLTYWANIDRTSISVNRDRCVNSDTLKEYGCMNGRFIETDLACNCVGSVCMDDFDAGIWDKFLRKLDSEAYSDELKELYRTYYTSLDTTPEQLFQRMQEDGIGQYFFNFRPVNTSFYSRYKNSGRDTPIIVNMLFLYPSELEWQYNNLDNVARASGFSSAEAYLNSLQQKLSNILGRNARLKVNNMTISYSYYFLCEECSDIIRDGEGRTTIDASRGTDDRFYSDFLYYGDKTPRDNQIIVLMSNTKNSPEGDIRLQPSFGSTAMGFDDYGSVIFNGASSLNSILIHEFGHSMSLPHPFYGAYFSTGEIHPILPSPSAMEYPISWTSLWSCYFGTFQDNNYYSPFERFILEPKSGFRNSREYATQYMNLIECED